jgi:predicted metal-binding membrane protein
MNEHLIMELIKPVSALTLVAVAAWLVTTWMKVRHGYPLTGSNGQTLYPSSGEETIERIRLLTQENSQLRAEIGAVKDRLANVERIVTDGAHSLDREIEQLRLKAN